MPLYLCDSNIWVAVAIEQHSHGTSARHWLDSVGADDTIWFCRATQQSFLRLLSNTAVLSRYGLVPLTNIQAWDTFDTLLQDERIAFRQDEPPGLEGQWRAFSARPTASTKLWMDAYLAAFAYTAGYQLVTTDRAFSQFEGLDVLLLGDGTAA